MAPWLRGWSYYGRLPSKPKSRRPQAGGKSGLHRPHSHNQA